MNALFVFLLNLVFLPAILTSLALLKVKNNNFEECISEIVNKYFYPRSTLVVISEPDSTISLSHEKIQFAFDKLEMLLNNRKIKFNNILLQPHNGSHLNEMLQTIKLLENYNSRAKYIVVTPQLEEVEIMGQLLWNFRLYNSVVIHKTKCGNHIFEFDTKNFDCSKSMGMKKISFCNHGNFTKNYEFFNISVAEIYHYCPLRVTYFPLEPWTNDPNNSENPGILIKFMQLYAETNNLLIEFLPKLSYKEDMDNSYSFDLVYEDFEAGLAEIYGGISSLMTSGYFDVTVSYSQFILFWIVPKAPLIPEWKVFFQIVSPLKVLYFTLIYLVVASSFILILHKLQKQFPDLTEIFLYFFALSLNVSWYQKKYKNIFLRYIIIVFSLISLLVAVIIQGKLFDSFKNPLHDEEIDDVDKLLESHMTIKFQPAFEVAFMGINEKYEKITEIYIPANETYGENLQNALKTKNFATLIDNGAMITQPLISEVMNVFEIGRFHTVFYMKKYHELFEHFNINVLRLTEAGLHEKIVSDTTWFYYLKDKTVTQEGDDVFQLGMKHLQGAFVILGLGYTFAFASLCIEIVLSKFRGKRAEKKLLLRQASV